MEKSQDSVSGARVRSAQMAAKEGGVGVFVVDSGEDGEEGGGKVASVRSDGDVWN